MRNQTLIQ